MILKRFFSSKFVTAFVSVVLLANLLMPAIAGATVKRDKFSALFSVVCTSSGLKIVDANGNQSAPVHSQQDTVHCPLCVIGGSPALPSQISSVATLSQAAIVFESVLVSSIPYLVFWPSASPRGPPATA